eukprot:TRINITY_DN2995_c0_g1_i4.p1 TRINITY_DN2995_c0_g1~~TRINITY_DN2995_c0_g1_i4.p1  ORF type:complete len:246 (-),score=77.10 TRINITY_DN2995_c0_g1_i4:72-809(-)
MGDAKESIGCVKTKATGKIFSVQIEIDSSNVLKVRNEDFEVKWTRNLMYDDLKYAKYEEVELDKQESEHTKANILRNEYEKYIHGHKGRVEELKRSNAIDEQTEKLSHILINQELEWAEKIEKIVEDQFTKKKDYVGYLFELIFKKRYEELGLLTGLSKEFGDELSRMKDNERRVTEKINNLKQLYTELKTEFENNVASKITQSIELAETYAKQTTAEKLETLTSQLKDHLREGIRDLQQIINNH